MPAPPKRRLSELLKLYELEPQTKDIFVEGPSDRAVFDWVIAEARPFGTTVRWVDEIDLDLEGFDTDGGSKGRLVALAQLAERTDKANLICVVDRNRDQTTDINVRTYLHPTVYPDIEFHLARGDDIANILTIATGVKPPEGAIEQALTCTNAIYATLMFADSNSERGEHVPIGKSLRKEDSALVLDLKHYLSRMDSKNDTGILFSDSFNDIQDVMESFQGDLFMFAEFHRFEECLEVILRRHRYNPDGLFATGWLGRLVRASMIRIRDSLDEFFLGVVARLNG